MPVHLTAIARGKPSVGRGTTNLKPQDGCLRDKTQLPARGPQCNRRHALDETYLPAGMLRIRGLHAGMCWDSQTTASWNGAVRQPIAACFLMLKTRFCAPTSPDVEPMTKALGRAFCTSGHGNSLVTAGEPRNQRHTSWHELEPRLKANQAPPSFPTLPFAESYCNFSLTGTQLLVCLVIEGTLVALPQRLTCARM